MNTLDFGEIMEQDCWFEHYDLNCPVCKGNPEVESRVWKGKCLDSDCKHTWTVKIKEPEDYEKFNDGPDECPECLGEDVEVDYTDTEIEHCEECTEGSFEVYWNTAYEVHLPHNMDFEEAHRLAWDHRWCLITHGNDEHYLLAGGCGYDFSWKLHYIRWKIQDYLDVDDIYSFINGGGHVFLGKAERDELLRYCRSRIPTPSEYTSSYRSTVGHIDALLFPKEDKEDERQRPVHVE